MELDAAKSHEEISPRATVDVGRVLEERPWGSYQTFVIFLTALTVIVDGADGQLLGIAIPAIAVEWEIARGAFAPTLALGFVGMMIGGAVAGMVGDRYGRRFALVCSVLIFSAATIATAGANGLLVLGTLRFLAGFGLQGAVTNAAALISEYAPLRYRAFAVTLAIVCFPLGAALAGLVAIPVLPTLGWRALFVLGGVVPIGLALTLARYLPESPRFLARQPARRPELVRVLGRLGYQAAPDAVLEDSKESVSARAPWVAILNPGSPLDTIGLWSASFFCMLAVYSGFNWIPSLLTGAGLPSTVASMGVTFFNLGGVVGALTGGAAISRLGSKPTMLTMAAGAMTAALVLRAMTFSADVPTLPILLMLGVTGALINAIQVTMYALAAHVYPTTVRATGVGTALGVGRLGAILSTYAGAWALESGGTVSFFTLVAGAMLAVVISLSLVRRHIPSPTAVPRAATA